MTSPANGKVKKLIPPTAPEYWKAGLPSVRLQRMGNKKVYETGFGYRKLGGNQSLRISEEIDANVGLRSPQPAILLIENKWFVGFKGLACWLECGMQKGQHRDGSVL